MVQGRRGNASRRLSGPYDWQVPSCRPMPAGETRIVQNEALPRGRAVSLCRSPCGGVTRRNPICLGFPMSSKTPITVAHGDGIGPEIMAATLHILEASGAALEI